MCIPRWEGACTTFPVCAHGIPRHAFWTLVGLALHQDGVSISLLITSPMEGDGECWRMMAQALRERGEREIAPPGLKGKPFIREIVSNQTNYLSNYARYCLHCTTGELESES